MFGLGKKRGIVVPHLGKKLVFSNEPYGPDDYAELVKQIENEGLLGPKISELASLFYVSFKEPDKENSQIVLNLWKESRLTAFTTMLCVPKKGMFIQDYPLIENKKIIMREKELESRLGFEKKGVHYSDDRSVKFIPIDLLSQERCLIALIGEENTDRFAKIFNKYHVKLSYLECNQIDEPSIKYLSLFNLVPTNFKTKGRLDTNIHITGVFPDRQGYTFGKYDENSDS